MYLEKHAYGIMVIRCTTIRRAALSIAINPPFDNRTAAKKSEIMRHTA